MRLRLAWRAVVVGLVMAGVRARELCRRGCPFGSCRFSLVVVVGALGGPGSTKYSPQARQMPWLSAHSGLSAARSSEGLPQTGQGLG